jgi:hypothetical protein
MPPTTAALEIHLHLEDGRTVTFAQNDAATAQKILSHIDPHKVFAQHPIILSSKHSMTTILPSALVRIDLIGDNLPHWPQLHNVQEVQEISEEVFRQRFRPELYAQPARPGEVVTAYAELALVNGSRIFVEVRIEVEERLPADQAVFIQQLFTAGGLHAKKRGGGISLLNPAKLVSFSFYPGPQVLPPGTWEAERLPH